MMSRRIISGLAIAALASGMIAASAAPSNAGMCNSSKVYKEVLSKKAKTKYLGVAQHNDNRKGRYMESDKVTLSANLGLDAVLKGSIEGGISRAIISAKAAASSEIRMSLGASISRTTELKAKPGEIAYAQLTTLQWTTVHRDYKYNSNCKIVEIRRATLTAPTSIGISRWYK